jgi:hypothetical protein
MAKAKQPLALPPCPQDGWTFEEALQHVSGARLWGAFKVAQKEYETRHSYNNTVVRNEAFEALTFPLFHLWEAGELVVKGRRGDPLAAFTEIPAAAKLHIAWHAWDLSTLGMPEGEKETIYDVRVWTKSVEQEAFASRDTDYKTSAFKELEPRQQLAVRVIDDLEAHGMVLNGMPLERLLSLVLERARELSPGTTISPTTLKIARAHRRKHPLNERAKVPSRPIATASQQESK